jgi:glycosyltransferase involved in cell wall biosynthesis
MKFLFIPEYQREFDFRIAHKLGHALEAAGHFYELMPTDGYNIGIAGGHDVVLGINRPRPEKLPSHVVYIAWVQDYRPLEAPDYAGQSRGSDIIYTLGSETWIGMNNPGPNFRGSLLTGVDPKLLNDMNDSYGLDFSICGYITLPFSKMDMHPLERRCFKEAERLYKPLTGSSNAFLMANQLQEFVEQIIATEKIGETELERLKKCCNWMSIEFPRYIDRLRIAQLAYLVSPSCGFYGVNWQKYYQFGNCTFAPIKDEAKLHDIYRRSKVNLHNNWNGFGLHSRVLEAMAVGGFVMAHSCADPQAAGRITTDFEPNVHFGEYTPDNFVERAKYWLQDDAARSKAITESRKIVADKHLWKHRAQQILHDLN